MKTKMKMKKEVKEKKGSTLHPVWIHLCEIVMLGAVAATLWPWNKNQKKHTEADLEPRQ